jgi:prophage regulatory protein
MTKRFIKLDQVKQMTSLSRAAIYKRIAHGTFPPQVKLGTTSVWLESEVETWIQSKVDERDRLAA